MIGAVAGPGKRQWHESHAWRIEVFIAPTLGIDPIEPTHHVTINHVHHGLGRAGVNGLHRGNALLQDHFLNRAALLANRHLVAGTSIQIEHVRRIAHAHDAHPIGPCVRFDDHKGLLLNPVFAIFRPHLGQQPGDIVLQTTLAFARLKVDLATGRKIRINEPSVDPQHLGEFLCDLRIGLEVMGLATDRPTGVQGR